MILTDSVLPAPDSPDTRIDWSDEDWSDEEEEEEEEEEVGPAELQRPCKKLVGHLNWQLRSARSPASSWA